MARLSCWRWRRRSRAAARRPTRRRMARLAAQRRRGRSSTASSSADRTGPPSSPAAAASSQRRSCRCSKCTFGWPGTRCTGWTAADLPVGVGKGWGVWARALPILGRGTDPAGRGAAGGRLQQADRRTPRCRGQGAGFVSGFGPTAGHRRSHRGRRQAHRPRWSRCPSGRRPPSRQSRRPPGRPFPPDRRCCQGRPCRRRCRCRPGRRSQCRPGCRRQLATAAAGRPAPHRHHPAAPVRPRPELLAATPRPGRRHRRGRPRPQTPHRPSRLPAPQVDPTTIHHSHSRSRGLTEEQPSRSRPRECSPR